jgi:hypothetical protein
MTRARASGKPKVVQQTDIPAMTVDEGALRLLSSVNSMVDKNRGARS